ncbi:MAG TPA: asparagine synthetase B [Verrucomicrobiae bacterium]|nr:asparagine synthetase B [Verrucomicrobiae bacterium]
MKKLIIFLILCFSTATAQADKLLIYMDGKQTDHLKAYGVAYWVLGRGQNVEWLLNYRGGSFMTDPAPELEKLCRLKGVAYDLISTGDAAQIYQTIEDNNMEVILLEKTPKIAIYTPPNKEPWDDAVTLALTYAEIPYGTLWDAEVMAGELAKYDWIHLHHEDFSGQYGKFYAMYRNADWYRQEVAANQTMAHQLGFAKVSELKKGVARAIKDYVAGGGMLFAMCSATETIDIAFAADSVDICDAVFDGDPPDAGYNSELNFNKTWAFTNFTVFPEPFEHRRSDIDVTYDRSRWVASPKADFFTLFEFSAKLDPVPTMLVQNHNAAVAGFMGLTTALRRSLLKKHVTILGEIPGVDEVRYIHGNFGQGTWTFLAGHDPEDYEHQIGDPPTDLSLHKNSPGYRLILNNVLFPAARQKERKT